MNKQEKLEILRNFNEKDLINKVIIPLLEKMGFKNITVTHGTSEKGIDLVFYKESEFGEREYTGVQVKATKIHGSTAKKGNVAEILYQALLAFNHEFPDISDSNPKHIDRYMVMTSGEITPEAKMSICEARGAAGQFKSIQFIDGEKLAQLVNKCMPHSFWEEYRYFNRYFKKMKEDFETIEDISAMSKRKTVNLEDIYVTLKLSETVSTGETVGEKNYDKNSMALRGGSKKPEVKEERVLELDTAMKYYPRMVIVGAAGAGKTTILKYYALENCKKNIEKQERIIVPIFITLREFLESSKGLGDYIEEVFEKYEFPKAKKFVENELKSGKCTLLLDGFDELASSEAQEKVIKEVHDFVKKYDKCSVVVTSREAAYNDQLLGFDRLEVVELDNSQIKGFIDKWFGEANRNNAESM